MGKLEYQLIPNLFLKYQTVIDFYQKDFSGDFLSNRHMLVMLVDFNILQKCEMAWCSECLKSKLKLGWMIRNDQI